jgi:tetratricopeptide (TPR) repeat protein
VPVLVDAEIEQLALLVALTPLASPDRPMLVRRLAEDYVEVEKAAGTPPAARERGWRQAIRFYSMLMDEYSGAPSANFPSNPPRPYHALDEVAYDLAYEHERAGDDASARHGYAEIVTKFPSSTYVPKAYLALGERRFAEMRSNQDAMKLAGTWGGAWAEKWDRTWATYRKVLETPAAENPVYGYAWYKLGYVYVNLGHRFLARYAFQQAVDFATTFPETPGAKILGDEAQAQVDRLSR